MDSSKPSPSRRGFMWGAAVAGGAAAAAATLPKVQPQDSPVSEPAPAPAKGGGYRLSEHVLHYYKTARI